MVWCSSVEQFEERTVSLLQEMSILIMNKYINCMYIHVVVIKREEKISLLELFPLKVYQYPINGNKYAKSIII